MRTRTLTIPGCTAALILGSALTMPRTVVHAAGALPMHQGVGAASVRQMPRFEPRHGQFAPEYALAGTAEVGVRSGAYQAQAPRATNPVLDYSTYAGRAADAQAGGVAADRLGDAYMVGTAGLGQASRVFVTKYDPTGGHVLFSTSISAPCGAVGTAIAVDASGNAYLTGQYGVRNPYNLCLLTTDVLVAKLDPAGHIIYQKVIGPSSKDEFTGSVTNRGNAIAVDRVGNAYVTGRCDCDSFSPRVLATAGAFQRTGHIHDGFVLKLDPAGNTVYCTYLGGSDIDEGRAIAVDAAGDAYVTGSTQSHDFPVTLGAFQRQRGKIFKINSVFTGNAFIAVLNPTGSALLYGTYLGGGIADSGTAIAVDGAHNVYVTGLTGSPNFPTTPGAYDRTCGINGQCNVVFTCSALGCGDVYPDDVFVVKLAMDRPGAAALLYSTFLGGRNEDQGSGLAVDRLGHVWVTGSTASLDEFPMVNPLQPSLGGGTDAFVAELDPGQSGAASLLFSTYLGGTKNDGGTALALGPGSVYVTGYTYSSDFPTRNAGQGTKAGSFGAFVAKLSRP